MSRARLRRAEVLAACAGLVLALVIVGCASLDVAMQGPESEGQIDIVVLATDRATADEVLGRLEDVEHSPSHRVGRETWSRGQLASRQDDSVYTVLVGQVGGQDDTTTRTIMETAAKVWRPRYILLVGSALAVAYDAPLGAVGIVTLTCDFDLDRFEELQDLGSCYRPDGGLFAAALSIADEWEAAAAKDTKRAGCSPARVTKLAALSSKRDPEPGYVETATALSEDLHRGLIVEGKGTFAAEAVETLRHEMRQPIGYLMIRGVSEVRGPGTHLEVDLEQPTSQRQLAHTTCVARDTADFAVELIRRRWPVSSRTKR